MFLRGPGFARVRHVIGLRVFSDSGFRLPGGVGPVFDWPKFLLWGLTEFTAVVYLDADTLTLGRAPLDPLFEAVSDAPFAAVAFGPNGEVNNGVFALQPSLSTLQCLIFHARNGTFWSEPEFPRRGGTWQAFLDLFWLSTSPRLAIKEGSGDEMVLVRTPRTALQCPDSNAQRHVGAHRILPRRFNFPASFNAAANGWHSPSWVASMWAQDLLHGPVAILHWVGAKRKPWLHWSLAARSVFDRQWWQAHRAMCRVLSRGGLRKALRSRRARCRLSC
mmetsp:Transcript_95452/g.307701  ORF Transcript_95452/g.307701 Transcript_95452/m.307701 type:complete len:276 (+) Transcript_95452:868-1695(+)